jgi:hypothetical protein
MKHVYLSLQEGRSWMVKWIFVNSLNLRTWRRKGVFENQHTSLTQPTCTRCQHKEKHMRKWMDEYVCRILCSVDRASRYNSMVNGQFEAQFFFLICLLQSSTCFEQPRAHHQENKLYQYVWYISLCVGGRLECRSVPDPNTRRSPTQRGIYQMLYWNN